MSTNYPKAQRGAILVTSLLLLLVLTIIGITASQMTRMQERMAGNLRDQNLAFQGSEAALRDGEELVRTLATLPDTCLEAPCLFWGSTALTNVPAEDGTWWDENSTELEADGDRGSLAKDMGELAADPQFVIEALGPFPDPNGSLVEPDVRYIYQVTARSTGGSGAATTVLRTTYARRF